MSDERETMFATVTRCEHRRLEAMVARDMPVLESLLDDDLSYVHSTGALMDKQGYLAHVADPTFRYLAAASQLRASHLLEDGAILIASVEATIEKDGRAIALSLTSQAAWRRRGTEWRLIASTAAPVRDGR